MFRFCLRQVYYRYTSTHPGVSLSNALNFSGYFHYFLYVFLWNFKFDLSSIRLWVKFTLSLLLRMLHLTVLTLRNLSWKIHLETHTNTQKLSSDFWRNENSLKFNIQLAPISYLLLGFFQRSSLVLSGKPIQNQLWESTRLAKYTKATTNITHTYIIVCVCV